MPDANRGPDRARSAGTAKERQGRGSGISEAESARDGEPELEAEPDAETETSGSSDVAAAVADDDDPAEQGTAVPRRRARVAGQRQRRLSVRVSAGEHAEVVAAAGLVGLTPAGFTAAAARGASAPQASPVRAALGELMAARRQLRGYAVNLNQATRVLNAGGAAPEWLAGSVETSDRAVARVDEAAAAVARRVR